MANNIHKTAIVEEGATFGNNVTIGPYCVVGPKVTLGDNVTLRAHVVIDGLTTVGDGCILYPFASIGQETPDLKYRGEESRLIIGKNCKIREYVTMNPGTAADIMETRVGDNCLFMPSSHVAHDCIVGNNVIMANSAALGGHVKVGDNVVIGGLAAVHQHVRIGSNAVIGGMSGVESDVIPYGRVKGDRAYLAGLNLIGLERRGVGKDRVKIMQRAFNSMFGPEGTLEKRLEEVEHLYAEDPLVSEIITFARNKSQFPLCQPKKAA